jgi:NADH dehydrogenase
MAFKKINLIITGSSGYVGSNLIHYALLRDNFTVTALSRSKINNPLVNILFYQLENELPSLPNNIDVVVHAAADMSSKPINEEIEINATKKLLQWTNLNKIRFIYISSNLASIDSRTRYGKVKYLIEEIVKKENGIIVRPTFIYGGVPKGAYRDYYEMINRSKFLPYFLPPIYIQPLYIGDLCNTILNICTNNNLQTFIFNVGYHQKVSFHKFVINLNKYKFKKRKWFIPLPTLLFQLLLFILSFLSDYYKKKYISFKYFRKVPLLDTQKTSTITNIKFKSIEESYKLE